MTTQLINLGDINNTLTLGDDNYIIFGTGGDNRLTLGGGNDAIMLGDGDNVLGIGDGTDTVTLGNGVDQLTTGGGDSSITVGDGAGDTVTVGDGRNTIALATGGSTIVRTGSGSNIVSVPASGVGADVIVGQPDGAGVDVLRLTTTGIINASGVSGFQVYQLADGGQNNLTLTNANFAGLPGATIVVQGGDDNTVEAPDLSSANAVIFDASPGDDVLIGGAGDDVFNLSDLSFGYIDGGGGTNTLALKSSGLALDLGTFGDRLRNIETINLAPGDALSVSTQNIEFLSDTGTMTVNGGASDTVSLLGTGWVADPTLSGSTTYTNGQTVLRLNATMALGGALACFAAGTRIQTSLGTVAVESLTIGDEVRTLLGGSGRIVWVGSRAVDCTRHPRPETVSPIRIARGALGDRQPGRTLFVSPGHAIYLDGVLIPARCLVNGTTVRQIKPRRVAYHHIELARHDVVFAEGLPAETYLDTGDRTNFTGTTVVALHPDFTARAWEMAGCAELVQSGPVLERILNRLNPPPTAPRAPTRERQSLSSS